jgi:hypothetical protein
MVLSRHIPIMRPLADPSIIAYYDFGVFLKKLTEMTKVNSGDKTDWGRLHGRRVTCIQSSANVRGVR